MRWCGTMFVILVYDINKKRVGKVLKICRKYLVHVQRSVFEGNITEVKLRNLKKELKRNICAEEDTIFIYSTDYLRYLGKQSIGKMENLSNII